MGETPSIDILDHLGIESVAITATATIAASTAPSTVYSFSGHSRSGDCWGEISFILSLLSFPLLCSHPSSVLYTTSREKHHPLLTYTPTMPSTTTVTATAVSSKSRSRQTKEQGKVQVTKKSERVSSSIATKTTPTVVGQNPRDDFFWSYTEEPHRTRRQAIIKAHPEVSNGSR